MLSVPKLCKGAPVHLTGLFFPVLTVSQDCGASDANECEVHSSALPGQCLTHPMTRTGARRLPFLKLSCAGLNPLHRGVTLPLPWLPCSLLLDLGKSPHPHLFDCFLWKDSFPQGSLLLTWPPFFLKLRFRVSQPLSYLPLISLSQCLSSAMGGALLSDLNLDKPPPT